MTRSIGANIAVLIVLLSACTTRQTITPPGPGEPHTAFKGEVRVVHVDGRSYVLRDTRIESDSVIGTNAAGSRIAIATNEVSTIDERRVSAARTAGLVGGTLLLAGVVVTVAGLIALASIF